MANRFNYPNPYDSNQFQITIPPNDFQNFDQYFWNQVKYSQTEAYEAGIWEYTHEDFVKCLTKDYCILPLTICALIFAYLSVFISTICVLYFVGVLKGLIAKLYCTLYQMAYFVSDERWKVDEKKLDNLRKDVLLNRDVSNHRFRSLDEDKVQINKLLRTFGL